MCSGGLFDVDAKKAHAAEFERQMEAADFWDHPDKAQSIITQLKTINTLIKPFQQLATDFGDIRAMMELAEEGEDESLLPDIQLSLKKAVTEVDQLEFKIQMSDPVDASNAFVTIQAGAGGTESCDWASMLYRMYVHWAEDHNYDLELIDADPAEQAGYRSITFAVRGEYAYGYLRGEAGVHRLVRISPFDAQSRRHTSFVAVDIMPELDDTIEIEVKESDIVMETFMSGGPGGQHQNKTASGVRLRHMPTGVVAECRSERSQHKNRKTAMNMLKARLYRIEQEKRDAELAKLYNEKGEIAFGSQIRSYTLAPYQMVKDHRTNVEVGNAGGVLEGKIDPFIEAYLKTRKPPSSN
ncbi:peptide chain release factor 2 [bacterium]|nr:peptide chain release factor 2 [bacterium]